MHYFVCLLTLGSKDKLVGNDTDNSESRQDDTKEPMCNMSAGSLSLSLCLSK